MSATAIEKTLINGITEAREARFGPYGLRHWVDRIGVDQRVLPALKA